MKKEEVKLILENQQVIMNALGNLVRNKPDYDRLLKQFKKNIPFVHDKTKTKLKGGIKNGSRR